MEQKYKHILSPLKVGNTIIKNRFYGTKGLPHFLQGGEEYPTEGTIEYYANLAKNGAAIVTVKGFDTPFPDRRKAHGDGRHTQRWNMDDPANHNYLAHVTDVIHYYKSLACINIQKLQPKGLNISKWTKEDTERVNGPMGMPVGDEITHEGLQELKRTIVERVKFYQSLGFDAVNLYMSYRNTILACSMSPIVNQRTDEYGGSLENRCRLIVELCKEVKEACGKDFIVEIQFSGEEGPEDGYKIEDTIELLRQGEGYIDIIHIRAATGDLSHPIGMNSVKEEPITLQYAEAIKKAGVKVITAPNGGYQDLDLIEKWIAEGKTDMVAMCRSFICDFDYYDKCLDGRGDDVVPCIRCNNCHGINFEGPWRSFCSVNPKIGIQHRLNYLAPKATEVKNVVVIGGGPGGMRAALEARARGHNVTLYEKKDHLGGQLEHSDYCDFKWPLKEYKDWLAYQLDKQGVKVVLNTAPTPEMIAQGGYDAIIAATGATCKRLNVPGGDSEKVWVAQDVFGHEAELGKKVVVVGGSETGVETGLYLANAGHEVVVLTRQRTIATDANQIHYIHAMMDYCNERKNFSYIAKASTVAVTDTSVTYKDAEGVEHTIECDSVVLASGVKPEQEAALQFQGLARQFIMVGDCHKPGRVLDCTRSAYAAASQI